MWLLILVLMSGQELELGSHTDPVRCERAAARMSATKPVRCVRREW
jgi:hypothetical protein